MAYKINSSISLTWQYTDYSGTPVDSACADPEVMIWQGSHETIPGGDTKELNDPGSSGLRYDSLTMTWHFNWQTKGLTAGIYTIFIKSN